MGILAGTRRISRSDVRAWAVLAVAVAVAYGVNFLVPALSALSVAVLLGVAAASSGLLVPAVLAGVARSGRKLLRAGVVLLGLQLAVPRMLALGPGVLLAVVLTVAVGFLGSLAVGALLRLPRGLNILLATGTSICGASAIAAMEGTIRRRESDVATAIALITLYGTLAIAAVPLLGSWLGLSDVELGIWAGLGVHEVGQVVAAAAPAGAVAVEAAIVVKLTRVVLLAPMVTAMGLWERGSGADGRKPPVVPLFVIGFLVMAVVNSLGVVPVPVAAVAKVLCTALLAAAMFSLGCAVRVGALVRTGGRALLSGLLVGVLVVGVACVLTLWLA
ncbi:YeiH family protein [Actinokineospora sp. UTMC 2448]|uniref:YeiH family protein n=1 Tax=Actinokineospora sp. UTMC 2448 TaxID=2268449 RepID=UPI002164A3B2|nr:putative sulfate exporter family transporter [Actinokineospora sp. UTMC 2448]UVS79563.1 hypothetical protein Actkin_03313 [Actinokineospora sp. UTMC 2448]